jgi:hypothetical protein
MKLFLPLVLSFVLGSTTFAQAQVAWINEFHYDNAGGDTGEFVEVAYVDGTDITPYEVYHYNGSGGGVIKTATLAAGTCSNGLCFTSKSISGLQNGPDGTCFLVSVDSTRKRRRRITKTVVIFQCRFCFGGR